MSIVPQDTENEKEISTTVDRFIKKFHAGNLLFLCGAGKQKGVPVMTIFRYLIMLMFDRKSMYMQFHTGSFKEDFQQEHGLSSSSGCQDQLEPVHCTAFGENHQESDQTSDE